MIISTSINGYESRSLLGLVDPGRTQLQWQSNPHRTLSYLVQTVIRLALPALRVKAPTAHPSISTSTNGLIICFSASSSSSPAISFFLHPTKSRMILTHAKPHALVTHPSLLLTYFSFI